MAAHVERQPVADRRGRARGARSEQLEQRVKERHTVEHQARRQLRVPRHTQATTSTTPAVRSQPQLRDELVRHERLQRVHARPRDAAPPRRHDEGRHQRCDTARGRGHAAWWRALLDKPLDEAALVSPDGQRDGAECVVVQ